MDSRHIPRESRQVSAPAQAGFSLLELLISIIIFLIITSITFSLFTNSVQLSRSEVTTANRDEAVKSALALMTAEIQQAGAHPDTDTPPPLFQANVNSGANRTIAVKLPPGVPATANRLRGINVGDRLTIFDPASLNPS